MTTRSEYLPGLGRELAWPGPPPMYSFSSLGRVERCPRQWALLNAEYPDVWQGRGYPDKPSPAALRGTCLHLALESLLREARVAEAPTRERLARAVRNSGGFSRLLEDAIVTLTDRLAENPRLGRQLSGLVDDLRAQLPLLRQRLQGMASVLIGLELRGEASEGRREPGPLSTGAYPELWLSAHSVRLHGQVDLLVISPDEIEIVDYKSGAHSADHMDQLELYAVIWAEDDVHNPHRRVVTTLRVAYSSHEVEAPAPTHERLELLLEGLRARISRADEELCDAPRALPTPENCRHCVVRHLCDPYWNQSPDVGVGRVDVELEIRERLSAHTWAIKTAKAVPKDVRADILRTADDRHSFAAGARLRVIDAYVAQGEQGEYIGVGQWSEVFELAS